MEKKTGRKNRVYSAEFKIRVIMDMREHGLSYHETARKYWKTKSRSAESNLMSTLHRWERIFLEEGAEGLKKEKRGRNRTLGYTEKRGRPRKLDKKTEEDLIAENQRLRMEIEYIKKLSALVLAEEQKNGKKQK